MSTPQPTATQQTASNKKFILAAEDDQFYAHIYKVKLAKEGFDVVVVSNGEWAIKAAQKRTPDLILLDLVMPTMDGFETLEALKSDPSLKDVNIIVLSNLGQEEDIEKAKSLGAIDYFVKANISIHEVIDRIKRYIRQ